jgi:hypothetical protein
MGRMVYLVFVPLQALSTGLLPPAEDLQELESEHISGRSILNFGQQTNWPCMWRTIAIEKKIRLRYRPRTLLKWYDLFIKNIF